jgi:hypothetical protein
MKRAVEEAEEEIPQVPEVEEGPMHRFKVVDHTNLILGQQYRIHIDGQSYERDRLAIYIGRDAAHNHPVFNKINGFDPETGKRFSHDTPIRFPTTYCIFFESGKTITAHKIFDPRGLPPQLLNGYGGTKRSRPIKRRTNRRRRIHRTVKSR